MNNVVKNLIKKLGMHRKNKLKTQNDNIDQKIAEEIKDICLEMEKTNIWFQMEVDENLIEACIHQREMLNARYRYLMSKIKPAQAQ